MSSDRKVILLVEDLEDDIVLIRRAFAAAKLDVPLQVVRDGEEAIAYLMGSGKYARRDQFPIPDLILLDLKMPKLSGLDVLRWLRSHPHLKTLRVIVLTSSEDIYDVNRAYELGANSFLVKPAEFICYPSLVRTLEKFWLRNSVSLDLSRPSAEANSNPRASS